MNDVDDVKKIFNFLSNFILESQISQIVIYCQKNDILKDKCFGNTGMRLTFEFVRISAKSHSSKPEKETITRFIFDFCHLHQYFLDIKP